MSTWGHLHGHFLCLLRQLVIADHLGHLLGSHGVHSVVELPTAREGQSVGFKQRVADGFAWVQLVILLRGWLRSWWRPLLVIQILYDVLLRLFVDGRNLRNIALLIDSTTLLDDTRVLVVDVYVDDVVFVELSGPSLGNSILHLIL